ncbi:hypothetical protein [Microbispora triticiradicis]|uniref:hypothetical protein n=1 Tax=Microbispora triticiradicis TaxID=2200763 RepID=UPI001AD63936|nr:hypothetical protein [Microbispora triticiradicis]MBO4270102.1 hypothetical protein [Microbispora triticiradicis]
MPTAGPAGAGATCLRALGVALDLPPMAGATALTLVKLFQFLAGRTGDGRAVLHPTAGT